MIHSCSDFNFHCSDALLNFPKREKKFNDRRSFSETGMVFGGFYYFFPPYALL